MPDPSLSDLAPLQVLLAERPAFAARAALALTLTALGAGVSWAALTRVHLVVAAPARVRPASGAVRGFLDDVGLRAVAPFGGRIAALLIRDGQRVASGDGLFRLDTEALDARVARAEAALHSLAQELALVRRTEAQTRRLAEATAARLDADIAAAGVEHRRATAERTAALQAADITARESLAELTRAQALVRSGGASQADLERATARAERARVDQRRAVTAAPADRSASLAHQRDESTRQAELELTRLAARGLALEREIAAHAHDRDEALRDRERATVRAAVAGVAAVAQGAAEGAVVTAGAPVVTLTPGAGLRVDAAVPVSEIEAVRVGAAVRVVVSGRELGPRHVARGRVRYVASDSESLGATGAHVYLVSVEVTADPRLRVGMMGTAEIHVGRRSVLSLLSDRIRHTARFE